MIEQREHKVFAGALPGLGRWFQSGVGGAGERRQRFRIGEASRLRFHETQAFVEFRRRGRSTEDSRETELDEAAIRGRFRRVLPGVGNWRSNAGRAGSAGGGLGRRVA